MEKILQIIGAKVVENQMVELTLIPYTSKEVREKKMSMFEMATKGVNVTEMVKEIQGERQQMSKLYVSQDEWLNDFKNKLYSSIKIKIDMEKIMPDRR